MTDLEEIRNDVLREMYSEAEPGFDFDEALEDPESLDDDWFDQHVLDTERQREILDKHVEKHSLTDTEVSGLAWECILNLGPRSSPK